MKVLSVFGTRPEAIKMAPVVKGLEAAKDIESRVCVSAQHREMLDKVTSLFGIVPDYDLGVMKQGQTLFDVTSAVLGGTREVLDDFRPDLVLVHGDTTTTLSASLAAYYSRVAVGHVEAGLRTRNIYSPYPEEINRRVTGLVARLHFAPTDPARENLLSEGVPAEHVFVTGNTVIDALHQAVKLADADPGMFAGLERQLQIGSARKLVLVTGHRRENFGGGFDRVCDALLKIAERQDVSIVFPVHLNPAVRTVVEARLGGCCNISIIRPQDYLPFVYLMSKADVILTDSGGIQEEAPSLGKPVLVMRDTTERPEAVAAGSVKLVGTDTDKIVFETNNLLDDPEACRRMSSVRNPYGDGKATERIIDALRSWAG